MDIDRIGIHTTLSKECRDWLQKESSQTDKHQGDIIETAINFYRKNRLLLEEYNQARNFLKELVKTELVEDFAKAKPLLTRLIHEEVKHSRL